MEVDRASPSLRVQACRDGSRDRETDETEIRTLGKKEGKVREGQRLGEISREPLRKWAQRIRGRQRWED